MTAEEETTAQNARDDQQCLSYGAKQGSDAYVTCRTQLAAARANADAIHNAAMYAPVAWQPTPAVSWQPPH
jgi:hypothetical protein